MFWYQSNTNGFFDGTKPLEEIGRVNINETENDTFYVLSNQKDDSPLFLNKETAQYIDVYYQQVDIDYVSVPG